MSAVCRETMRARGQTDEDGPSTVVLPSGLLVDAADAFPWAAPALRALRRRLLGKQPQALPALGDASDDAAAAGGTATPRSGDVWVLAEPLADQPVGTVVSPEDGTLFGRGQDAVWLIGAVRRAWS